MTTRMRFQLSTLVTLVLFIGACSTNPYVTKDDQSTGRLSNETVLLHSSTEPLAVQGGRLITGNDAAFHSKLEMIKSAKTSIDAMYYIFSDDFSSSVLTEALIEAAVRGVRVRLLLDYATNYNELDMFSMMEKYGNKGKGSLEVRLYNRPTRAIIQDAVYLTLGCGEAMTKTDQQCGPAKNRQIEDLFRAERIEGQLATQLGISNLNIGNSGLFLSGLYSKRADLIALAVLSGQSIDLASLRKGAGETPSAQERAQLKKVATIYAQSRLGSPLGRLTSKIQLALLSTLYGDTLSPMHEAFTGYLPVERPNSKEAARDWDHFTDYLHHKFLLVDQHHVQLGGRNVEDSYHMRQNPLTSKYVFMDTDLRLDLNPNETLQGAFDTLWNFQVMVASLADVRQHAPNDYAANHALVEQAITACDTKKGADHGRCVEEKLAAHLLTVDQRIEQRHQSMHHHASRYWRDYAYARAADDSPMFPVDKGAFAAYVENLPFYGKPGALSSSRSYGAVNGQEAVYGKRIHSLWLLALRNVCATATAANPQRVVFHSAYFAPPSNLLRMLAHMTNGDLDCRHVRLTVLTNSTGTTDLGVVNLLAQQSLKAFQEFYATQRDTTKSPQIEYFEYQTSHPEESCVREKDAPVRHASLHTKVAMFGEDFLVGSANGDVRSYMMDSNNAILLRHAPHLSMQYRTYIDVLLKDKTQILDRTKYFASKSHEQMIQEDREELECSIQKYNLQAHLKPAEIQQAENRIVQLLTEAYRLSQDILTGGRKGEAAEEEYNRLFKPI